MNEIHNIDVVIPWVDGNDPDWQKLKDQYRGIKSPDKSEARYRDWDNLQYVFRGIEQFWPWVHRVFLVTNGQIPQWLNLDNKKVRLVTHAEYMPKEYLPTFSSHPIELNLHRIADLSEQFIYMNDDFFPIRPLKPTDFFRDGLPCDSARQQDLLNIYVPGDTTIRYIDFTNLGMLNTHFRKHIVTRQQPGKWFGPYLGIKGMIKAILSAKQHFFTGFEIHHSAQPFLKSTFQKVWDAYPEYLHEHCQNKFRQNTDVNQWLMRYWQLAENMFSPYSMKQRRLYVLPYNRVDEIVSAIKEQRYDLITVNDTPLLSIEDFLVAKSRVNQAFADLLPRKSSYEK